MRAPHPEDSRARRAGTRRRGCIKRTDPKQRLFSFLLPFLCDLVVVVLLLFSKSKGSTPASRRGAEGRERGRENGAWLVGEQNSARPKAKGGPLSPASKSTRLERTTHLAQRAPRMNAQLARVLKIAGPGGCGRLKRGEKSYLTKRKSLKRELESLDVQSLVDVAVYWRANVRSAGSPPEKAKLVDLLLACTP